MRVVTRFLLFVFFTPLLADADESKAPSTTPLLDYAQDQPPPTQRFTETLARRLASVRADLARHPPPPDGECAHTLGAVRFAQRYDDLAEARSGLGDYSGAIEAYEKALTCTPRAPDALMSLSSELMHTGRFDDARAAAVRAATLGEQGPTLDSLLSQLDFIQEHWADAVARLRTLVVTEPDDQRSAYWQCFLWLAQRRAGVRAPELAPRTEQEQWPAQILETLQGTLSEAILLGVILKEDDEQRRREILAEALYYIGQLRLANGDVDTARRYFAATVNLKVLYFIEHHMALAEILKGNEGTAAVDRR